MALQQEPKVKNRNPQPEPVQSGPGPMEIQLQIEEMRKQAADLTKEIEARVDRLDIGAVKIEEAKAQGRDVSSWENTWIAILRDYEGLCDERKNLWKQIDRLQAKLAA